jgi:homoserine dehydrogenase
MDQVNVGIVGLGNVGSGTLAILAENADGIAEKLGCRLNVKAICSRTIDTKEIPAGLGGVKRTTDWRELVADPDVQIVAELVGGTSVAREIIDAAIAAGKSVVTANKELMALAGAEIWDPRDQSGHQPGDGGQRRRRHPHPRCPAGGHLGGPGCRATRHPERDQ